MARSAIVACVILCVGFVLMQSPTDSRVAIPAASAEYVAVPAVETTTVRSDGSTVVCDGSTCSVVAVPSQVSAQSVPTTTQYVSYQSSPVSYGSTGSAAYYPTTSYTVAAPQVSYGCTGSSACVARQPVRNVVRSQPVRSIVRAQPVRSVLRRVFCGR